MDPRQLLSHLSTAVLIIDDALIVRFANPAAAQFFNLRVSKLIDTNFNEQVLAFDISLDRFQHAITNGKSLNVSNALLVTRDGVERSVDLTLSPMDNSQSILELRMIDQQKRIEQQFNQDAQQQAARFLVRNLAHEIKNPLGGLRGAAQLLSKQVHGSEYQEFTDMIIEQADRMKALVDKLLGPQKPTPHYLQNIHQIIEKVIQLIEITLPSNIELIRDYDPSLPEITMDAEQIQQVVINLLQNAVQAVADAKGKVTLKTRTQHSITIGNKRFRSVLELSVIDDGPGVPTELKDTLFYPMVTGRAEGTGLGLSIAHNIARLHQGRIDCNSSPGHTIFVLTLPIKE
ncbi:nitrogen regulation protein NR(II) [Shewanella sp. 202IG2-18]|uniref:nitrogen regulation protein NR(II) n=1 Tax=Parashewanella hymeniacidonis TaxID=2807618 RepID=UPI001961D8C9|nr:nitrogen regulation protein NR(II) [Parashewanella hymeniacidonis]MBM7072785.1 nitrogen regulation protein NR(II) [Parashewanella hymeniacidonis]